MTLGAAVCACLVLVLAIGAPLGIGAWIGAGHGGAPDEE